MNGGNLLFAIHPFNLAPEYSCCIGTANSSDSPQEAHLILGDKEILSESPIQAQPLLE